MGDVVSQRATALHPPHCWWVAAPPHKEGLPRKIAHGHRIADRSPTWPMLASTHRHAGGHQSLLCGLDQILQSALEVCIAAPGCCRQEGRSSAEGQGWHSRSCRLGNTPRWTLAGRWHWKCYSERSMASSAEFYRGDEKIERDRMSIEQYLTACHISPRPYDNWQQGMKSSMQHKSCSHIKAVTQWHRNTYVWCRCMYPWEIHTAPTETSLLHSDATN